ncbi:MAG TPA: hypothetical protein VFY04_08825, partial [Solirubrobacterales bacterium]|nr:hypothetical protein [Solirubrobacterales bacterium]
MIRQARSYLVGAISSTALIAAAVVAFVLLVSAQALRDWPLGIGGGESSVAAEGAPGGAPSADGAGGAADAGRGDGPAASKGAAANGDGDATGSDGR